MALLILGEIVKESDKSFAWNVWIKSWLYGFCYFVTESYFVKISCFEIMIWDHISPLFCYFSINSYSSQCFQEKSSTFSDRNDPFEGRNWWKNRIMKTWFGITKWNHILKSHFRKHDFVWKLILLFNSLLIK